MGMKSNARRDGEDWILNGSKHFISGPCLPDFAIVFAATGMDETPRGSRKRITAFLVDVGTPGFHPAGRHKERLVSGLQDVPAHIRRCAPGT
jgi:alkylation response protein AidB-like acyl-CoA dehydrogenase